MYYNTQQINKEPILHCSQNRLPIKGGLYCWKCKIKTNKKTKRFDNCNSLFWHLVRVHFDKDEDKDIFPSKSECIERLQNISNEIQLGVLK